MWLWLALGIFVAVTVYQVVRFMRFIPPEHRREALPMILKGVLGLGRPRPTPDFETLPMMPAATLDATDWSLFWETTDGVTARQRVTEEGLYSGVFALDVDGTALGSTDSPGGGFSLWLHRRDGSRIAVPGAVSGPDAELLAADVDHGSVAWLQYAARSRRVELWRWDGAGGTRLVHALPHARRQGGPRAVGWVLIAGDVTAMTFVPEMVGTVIVLHPAHGVTHVAATAFPTLHRDLVAEQQGLHRAAVSAYSADWAMGIVSELDLDVWPPVLRALAREPMPGASTQMGEVLGFWLHSRELAIPGNRAIAFGEGAVTDPVGDGVSVAFVYAAPAPRTSGTYDHTAYLVDVDSQRRTVLSTRATAMVRLRGRFVSWSEMAPRSIKDWHAKDVGVTSWVAEIARVVEPLAEDPESGSTELT